LNRVGRNIAQPAEIIDRSAAVEFKSDGRTIRAQQGDTILQRFTPRESTSSAVASNITVRGDCFVPPGTAPTAW